MEFETLKKSHKKQIIIGALAICVIGGALTFATTRAKYKLTQDIKLATGTVNYTPYDFKIMAMYQSDDGANYTEINEMPSSGYTINEEKSYCTVDGTTQVKGKIKTENKLHIITNITRHDKCYIWFDKAIPTAEDTLDKLGITNVNESTPNFANVATTNEGIFKVEDGMYGGHSYYWRGAVINNYVTFAGKCWRIVRINGDGTIRIIYDGSTCHANGSNTDSIAIASQAYNSNYNQSNYVGWTYEGTSQRTIGGTASNAKAQIETWYNNNIGNNSAYSAKVADGKYCNDRNAQNGNTWAINGNTFYYATYQRIATSKQPTLSCPTGDVYTLKIGFITADEVIYAGGDDGYNNTSYYLYNRQNYWTMSPYYWFSNYSGALAYVFIVNSDGSLRGWNVNNIDPGLRPVINLRSDVRISSGDGTQSNPFVVE